MKHLKKIRFPKEYEILFLLTGVYISLAISELMTKDYTGFGISAFLIVACYISAILMKDSKQKDTQ